MLFFLFKLINQVSSAKSYVMNLDGPNLSDGSYIDMCNRYIEEVTNIPIWKVRPYAIN